MSLDMLRGIWTYRSFRNLGEPVGEFDKLKIWEAELLLDLAEGTDRIHGYLGERPAVVAAGAPYLNLSGQVTPGPVVSAIWRATGQPGTDYENWIYDYAAVVNPFWLDGKGAGHRPTLVGTVIRTVPHDQAPAGAVFSFIAVKRDFVEPRTRVPLKPEVVAMLASPRHRVHHQLWHASRDEWLRLSDAQKEALRAMNWQPGPKGTERHAFGTGMFANGSGEDFFFMHRQMIAHVKSMQQIEPWGRVPTPRPLTAFTPGFRAEQVGNPDGFAVPDAWVISGDPGTTAWLHELRRTSTLYSRFQTWEAQYTDPTYLSRVKLGELGARIEWTIHNWMHMRWASVPRDPDTGGAAPEGRSPLDFADKWFNLDYDYLGETFSSHVNPVFWRLHGWVDDRIEDWFRAHEAAHPGEVKRLELGGVQWFEPGKWVDVDEPWSGPRKVPGQGHVHGSGAHDDLDLDVEVMKNALRIIFTEQALAPALAAGPSLGPPRATWFRMIDADSH